MEPKHLAPITRTTAVNDVAEIPSRLGAIPGQSFVVIPPDGRRRPGFRDGTGTGWVLTNDSHLPQALESVATPYLISYPIAPVAAPEDPVVVRAGVLSTEQERSTYAGHFIDPDGEESSGQQAMAIDGQGTHHRLYYDWNEGALIAANLTTYPGGGTDGVGQFDGLPLPITVVELD